MPPTLDAATHVIFLCWGNICRSPMAERVLAAEAAKAPDHFVRFTSAGVSAEESGHGMDRRAVASLRAPGYDGSGHTAHRITAAEAAEADLVIAMETQHVDRLRRILAADGYPAEAASVALLTDFDPSAEPGSPVPDPWYGGPEDFELTLAAIRRAVPGILAEVGSGG